MVQSIISKVFVAVFVSFAAIGASANDTALNGAFAAGQPVISSDGELVGVLRSPPRVRGDRIRLFVKGVGGSTFNRFDEDTLIDLPLARLGVSVNSIVLPETERYIRQVAYVPDRFGVFDRGAIRVRLR